MDFDDSAFYFHAYYHFSSLQTIFYIHLKTDNAQLPFSLLISLRISRDTIPEQKEKNRRNPTFLHYVNKSVAKRGLICLIILFATCIYS